METTRKRKARSIREIQKNARIRVEDNWIEKKEGASITRTNQEKSRTSCSWREEKILRRWKKEKIRIKAYARLDKSSWVKI